MKKFFQSIWYLFVGAPAQLTYWLDGEKPSDSSGTEGRVRHLRDLKPYGISYLNVDTDKKVIIRSANLSYIIKEE